MKEMTEQGNHRSNSEPNIETKNQLMIKSRHELYRHFSVSFARIHYTPDATSHHQQRVSFHTNIRQATIRSIHQRLNQQWLLGVAKSKLC
jgi:hypothetical protein